MDTGNFEALIITIGIVGLVSIVSWLIYSIWSKWLDIKHGKLNQKQLEELEQRIRKLEAQEEVKVEKRLAALEEIVVSDDFDVRLKMKALDRLEAS